MEGVKKEGFFRKFIKWLGTPEEDDIVNGEINSKAFSSEDEKVLEELKSQSKKIEKMGESMFKEKSEKRKDTINKMKATINQSSSKEKQEDSKEVEEKEQELE